MDSGSKRQNFVDPWIPASQEWGPSDGQYTWENVVKFPLNPLGGECHSSPLGKPCPLLICPEYVHSCSLTVASTQHTHIQTSPNIHALWLWLFCVQQCSMILGSKTKEVLFLFPPSIARGSLPGTQHLPIPLPLRIREGQLFGLLSPFTQTLATKIPGQPEAWDLVWANLPVLAGPAALPLLRCASSCLEEANPSQLCRGCRENISILGWAGMRALGLGYTQRSERATRSMALHTHIYAHRCYSLCPRWALYLYTSLVSCGSFFLPG